MRSTTKRGSIFYTVDTLIGGFILTLTVIILLSLYVQPSETREPRQVLDNTVNFFTTNTLQEIHETHSFVYDLNGSEPDTSYFLYQYVSYLQEEGDTSTAEDIAREATELNVPSHLGVRYEYDGTVVYERAPSENTSVITTSIMTHYIYNNSVNGPKTTRISVIT